MWERTMGVEARLKDRIHRGAPVLLDGALGTELERAGVRSALPLWTTHALLEAPRSIERIQRRYALAGAEILTAASFRTQRRTLAKVGLAARAAELTGTAVQLARRAAEVSGTRPFIAGSAAPLEDCYRPDLAPDQAAAEREHHEHAAHLADAGVDLILIETMNTIREAVAAARAARATGLAFLVSFVCRADGRLLSNETLEAAIDSVASHQPLAVLVNCLPPSAVEGCLPALRDCAAPFGVYANLGAPSGAPDTHREECSPAEFARHAETWTAAGARLIGGCCGTTPDHIRALAALAG
jgi:S-methylmethionine-dependent homocysteine/selenocysteine methylase